MFQSASPLFIFIFFVMDSLSLSVIPLPPPHRFPSFVFFSPPNSPLVEIGSPRASISGFLAYSPPHFLPVRLRRNCRTGPRDQDSQVPGDFQTLEIGRRGSRTSGDWQKDTMSENVEPVWTATLKRIDSTNSTRQSEHAIHPRVALSEKNV